MILKQFKIAQMSASDEEKLISDGGQCITLHDDHVHYVSKAEWEILDDDTNLMVAKKFYNDLRVAKIGIVEIQMFRLTTNGFWVVECGYFKCIFDNYKEAKNFHTELSEWKFDITY